MSCGSAFRMRLFSCPPKLPVSGREGRGVIDLLALHPTKAGNRRLCLKTELTAGAPLKESVSNETGLWYSWVMPLGAGGSGTSVCVPGTVGGCAGM